VSAPLEATIPAQRGALARAFLERFFENEITARSTDLRSSFFWLIGILGAPGVFMAVMMSWTWEGVFLSRGFEAVGRAAWPDKTLYLGLSMVVTGLLVSVVWSALLLDRRDASILGVLPLRPRTILEGKLIALAIYTVLVLVGMHAAASIAFGAILGTHGSLAYVLRNIVAHLTAATLASLFVFVVACAAQSVCLLVLGPRLFARLSPLLQTLLVALALTSLLALPTVVSSVSPTLEHAGVVPLNDGLLFGGSRVSARVDLASRVKPWIMDTPVVWFLGLYEWLLGAADPVLTALARMAVIATGAATALVLVVYPLAYRRLLVETVAGTARVSSMTRLSALIPGCTARRPQTRAAVQFLLATAGRMERHRLTIALACGAAAAFALPLFVNSRSAAGVVSVLARVEWLSLPLSTMLFLAVGSRIVASLPSELQATWLFASIDPDPRRGRSGVFRLILGLCVIPMAIAGGVLGWWVGGPDLAVAHGALSLAAGLILTEALLYQFGGMPCSRPWSPENASVRKFWPLYLLAFVVFTRGVPLMSEEVAGRPGEIAVTLVLAGAVSVWLRRSGRAVRRDDDYEIDVLPHISVLNLD
jgi:hypothetical protein